MLLYIKYQISISKTLLFIILPRKYLCTYHYSLSNILYIYVHVSVSAQPSKFHYVIGSQLHNEIQSAHILETSMSAKEVENHTNVQNHTNVSVRDAIFDLLHAYI